MMGYGPDWGYMGSWGGWGGWGWAGPLHMIFWLLVLVLIVAAIIWVVRSAGNYPARMQRRSTGLDVLEERYARGEIKRDEYLEKKRDITG